MDVSISAHELNKQRLIGFGPVILDVRPLAIYAEAQNVIPGSIRRDAKAITGWWKRLDLGRSIVTYSVHGREVSQGAAAFLREHGFKAQFLEGGIEAWQAAGETLAPKPAAQTTWVTRERPKIDRIACPWLIRRFIDPDAQFIYVPARDVLKVAAETSATPYDVPDVEFTHVGDHCSFDTFIARYKLTDPALLAVAEVVRGADTDRLDLAAPAAGLFAISLGLSANVPDDHEMLRYGLLIYDALYRWHRDLSGESHNWPPVKAA